MGNPLLRTKLFVPPAPAQWVSRWRLVERLNQGLGRKLTLISAPAGFGKTTLLSEWVHLRGGEKVDRAAEPGGLPIPRFAWLSLDEGDNDLPRFLTYAIAALQRVDASIGQSVLKRLESPQGPRAEPSPPDEGRAETDPEEGQRWVEALMTPLINDLSTIPGRTVLVLDDYHLITDPAIHEALTFLLDHMPANLHVVVATRSDPPLPVARLRGRGQINEVRMADLRFTGEEVAAFLQRVVALDLSVDDVQTLSARTEGWIAGLQMAALALQANVSARGREARGQGAAEFIRAFTGSDRYILDYLVEEVLQHQPQAIQSFLTRTAVLERLTASLCDAILEAAVEGKESEAPTAGARVEAPASSQQILEYLERCNLFIVPLDSERRWYRYHRLLADLLRSRLLQRQPELVSALHRKASAWYEGKGSMTEAIEHALAAQDLGRAARLVEQVAEETLLRGEVSTFLRWVGALPERVLMARPSLCVYYAWILLMRGEPLGTIETLLANADRSGDGPAMARAMALRGLLAGFRGQMLAAFELSRRALAELPEEDQFVRTFARWLLRTADLVDGGGRVDSGPLEDVLRMSQWAGNVMLSVMVACNLAELSLRQGQLQSAAAMYQRALSMATGARGQKMPIAGQALIGLAEVMRQCGDLDAAGRYLMEGIDLTEQWSETGVLEAYICLGRIRSAQGDAEGAWRALGKARTLAVQFDVTDLDDLTVEMFQAGMHVAQGDLDWVRAWAEERGLYRYMDAPLEEGPGDSYEHRMRKYELLVVARLLIAENRLEEALKLLGSLVPIAKWRARPGLLIEIYALQALAHQGKGEIDQALAALQEALALGQAEGYVQVFADEGPPMARLLYELAARGYKGTYVSQLLAAFPVEDVEVDAAREAKAPMSDAGAGPSPLVEPLSEREVEVLALVAAGLSNPEIAEQLIVSVNTIKTHTRNLYGKLGVHSRTQAIAKAQTLGIL